MGRPKGSKNKRPHFRVGDDVARLYQPVAVDVAKKEPSHVLFYILFFLAGMLVTFLLFNK